MTIADRIKTLQDELTALRKDLGLIETVQADVVQTTSNTTTNVTRPKRRMAYRRGLNKGAMASPSQAEEASEMVKVLSTKFTRKQLAGMIGCAESTVHKLIHLTSGRRVRQLIATRIGEIYVENFGSTDY